MRDRVDVRKFTFRKFPQKVELRNSTAQNRRVYLELTKCSNAVCPVFPAKKVVELRNSTAQNRRVYIELTNCSNAVFPVFRSKKVVELRNSTAQNRRVCLEFR